MQGFLSSLNVLFNHGTNCYLFAISISAPDHLFTLLCPLFHLYFASEFSARIRWASRASLPSPEIPMHEVHPGCKPDCMKDPEPLLKTGGRSLRTCGNPGDSKGGLGSTDSHQQKITAS